MTMTQTIHNKKTEIVFNKPSMYKVIFNNDNSTPMDFVIDLLTVIFRKTQEDATVITMAIHEEGKGVAGLYTHEIAEQKQNEAVYVSRTNGHPLSITLEAE